MDKNSANFSIDEIMRIANSPEGKRLLSMLQQADPKAIQKAMSLATQGNLDGAKKALEPITAAKDIQELMQQMGG